MARTLLIVDDSMMIRVLIADTAVAAGWRVVGEATNGAQAIERYRELRPDVVALDLVMPQYDGLHALRGIREFDPTAKVLVVSAIDQEDVLAQAVALGASAFVVKPFARPRLLHALDQLAAADVSTQPEESNQLALCMGARG